VHAALFAAAYPPLDLWPLVLVAPAPLAWAALRARTTATAVLIVVPIQWLMWLLAMRWLIGVTVVGYVLLGLYLSLYAAAFAWILRRLDRWPATAARPMALLLPIAWVGLECLRGALLFDGYPWFLLGHPLVEWPLLAQSADLLGTYVVSFLAAAVAGLMIDGARVRQGRLAPRAAIAAAAVVVGLHGLNLAYGAWRGRVPAAAGGPTLAVVQTNLPQNNKIGWPRDRWRADVGVAVELTRRCAEQDPPVDAIIWPETMLPGLGLEPQTLRLVKELGLEPDGEIARGVAELAAEVGRPLLIGSVAFIDLAIARDPEPRFVWGLQHNSAYVVAGPPPYQRYDKQFLTPFGEVMPYISAWPWLEEKLLALGAQGMSFSLDPGPRLVRLEIDRRGGGTVTVGTPICFEDTVPAVCRRMVYDGDGNKAADVLVNLSNDGWFGRFDGGRSRHSQIARFRCIENRVPMVRAVNTGQSVAFDSAGNVIAAIGAGRYGEARQAGVLTVTLPLDGRHTLYGRVGDVWAWACLLLGAAMMAGTLLRPGSAESGGD
jgi:apolipoprotein N-acyltransferase